MPTDYNCECCKYYTQVKTNYINHINTAKHYDNANKYAVKCKYCTNIVNKLEINNHYTTCKNKQIFDNLILDELAKQTTTIKTNLEVDCAPKINKLTEKHSAEIKKLEKKYFNLIAHKNKDHKKEIESMKQEYKLAAESYKKEIESLRCEHKIALENARQEYKKDLENYKKESSVMNATLCNAKDKHIETVETIIKTCGKITEKSVEGMASALTYANTELVNGPVLTKLCNFDFVDNEDGVNDLLHYNTENVLHEYIGDIIIGLYKKDKPIDQALWNTDSSRLVYIIRQKVDTKTLWEKDLNLERIKSFIIAPIIEYFIECIDRVKIKANKFIDKNKDCRKHDKLWNLLVEKEQMCVDLIHIKTILLNPKLSKNIIKYITPKFSIGPQLAMAKQK
jgi:hypothetical protein